MQSPQTSDMRPVGRGRALARALKGGPGIFLALMLVIWLIPPFISEDTGLRLGMYYRIFFTSMVLLGALFFWLLGKETIRQPQTTGGVVATLVVVLLVTIGLLVLVGVRYPQFQRPEPPSTIGQDAAERGLSLFQGATPPCIQCHTVSGRGGTRGPDLTQIASRAGQRVAGLSAEQYLREKIVAGLTYQFTVPEFAPIMPPFGQILTEAQTDDVIAYLMTLN